MGEGAKWGLPSDTGEYEVVREEDEVSDEDSFEYVTSFVSMSVSRRRASFRRASQSCDILAGEE